MTVLIALALLLLSATAHAGPCAGGAELAFEGAEGAGQCTQGGRGGPVVAVSNLNDSGPGSLRDCLETMSGARICQPTVSGWVSGNGEDIIIRNPYVTFDGSTAQMGVKDGGIMVRANEVILRHIRVRPGLYQLQVRQPPQNANGIFFMSDEQGAGTHEGICDHCSVSWGSDDLMGVIFGATNITIQDSIIAEGLECEACGGKGLGMGSNGMKVSVIRSLFTNTWIRWPEITSGAADFVNTVAYNDNGIPAQINPIYGDVHINFVGNTFKWGPNVYNTNYQPIRTEGGIAYSATSDIFVDDNHGHYWDGGGQPQVGIASPDSAILWQNNGGITVLGARYSTGLPLVPTLPSAEAYDYVLDHAGAMPRDSTDTRIVNEVRNDTGIWKTSVESAGGWPALTGSSDPPTPPAPAVRYMIMALSVAVPGSALIASFTAPSNHSAQDWITFAPVGSAREFYMAGWTYVPAGASGSVSLPVPQTPGQYELRYLLNNGFDRGTTVPITVGSAPAPSPQPTPPPPVVTNKFSAITNSGKTLTFNYAPSDCPSGVSKATGPLVNGTRTITMTCKP